MTSIIARPRKDCKPMISEEAYERLKQHLISMGYRENDLQPIVWPEGSISAYRDHSEQPWTFRYKADVLREKKERMDHNLWTKRKYGILEYRPIYIWVFHCPGIFGGIFEGWWIYMVRAGGILRGGGCRGSVEGHLLNQILEMFPLVDKGLFDNTIDIEEWKQAFVKKYQRGKWCRKPQGKAPVLAEIKNGCVNNIIKKLNWPNHKGANQCHQVK